MGTTRDYQDSIKFEQFDYPEWYRPEAVSTRTQRLKETPTRVGLVLIGTSLFLATSLFTVLYFALLLYQIPKYDNIVDARLGDHYRYHLSSPYPGTLGIPEMQNTLSQPKVTSLAQGDGQVFLGTLGHGVQVYNKNNMLWKTIDAKSTKGEMNNDIREVTFQHQKKEKRFWALSLLGGISLGLSKDDSKYEYKGLYATKPWRYIKREDITAAVKINNRYIAIGTSSKGAAVYDTFRHNWIDLPEIKNQSIKKIIYHKYDSLIWFLSDKGVAVYVTDKGEEQHLSFKFKLNYKLAKENLIDLKVFAKTKAIALTSDQGCYIFETGWSNKLLGGKGIEGLTQAGIRYSAYWKGLFVVIGEAFGVSAYNPATRNWSALIDGRLPSINDVVTDDHTIALATADGVYVHTRTGNNRLLAGDNISKITLTQSGLLYLKTGTGNISQEVGWVQIDGKQQHILIGNDTLATRIPLKIQDVLVYKI